MKRSPGVVPHLFPGRVRPTLSVGAETMEPLSHQLFGGLALCQTSDTFPGELQGCGWMAEEALPSAQAVAPPGEGDSQGLEERVGYKITNSDHKGLRLMEADRGQSSVLPYGYTPGPPWAMGR